MNKMGEDMAALTLNIRGELMSLEHPVVMGILNVTPDSFYAASRAEDESAIRLRIERILHEGGTMVDIGGCSTRPGSTEPTMEEEWQRLLPALEILKSHYPEVTVSVDTYRAEIAKRSVEDYGVAIVNDISGGMIDPKMFSTVASLHVPYILMHIKGTPATMQQHCDYDDLMEEILLYFAAKIRQLRQLGVNDIILDPGFGFAKTLDQNYKLMAHLLEFSTFRLPLLVGISRKSMITRLLGITAEESLNATTVLNTFALLGGADILRVHDVKAAVEAVKIIEELRKEQ